MENVSAPYEAQFRPDGPTEMVAHNLADMIAHVADVIARQDERYRGYVRVTNSRRDLVFFELNALGNVAR